MRGDNWKKNVNARFYGELVWRRTRAELEPCMSRARSFREFYLRPMILARSQRVEYFVECLHVCGRGGGVTVANDEPMPRSSPIALSAHYFAHSFRCLSFSSLHSSSVRRRTSPLLVIVHKQRGTVVSTTPRRTTLALLLSTSQTAPSQSMI
jgi:hypothetical protein